MEAVGEEIKCSNVALKGGLDSPTFQSVLSVRFEVGVSLLLAPTRADKRPLFL